jgi:outer membrane murein-binding lipoprotein Lpp
VVWEAVSIFVGLFSIALAVYFGARGLGGKFDLLSSKIDLSGSKIDLLGSNLGSKLDLLIEKVDSIKEDTSTIRGRIDQLIDKVDNIREDTSIIRDKVILIEGRTRGGSPFDSFKGVVKKV